MKLIVGLGNPEPDYIGTRHNIGEQTIWELVTRYEGKWEENFSAHIKLTTIQGEKCLLMVPTTGMNNSGTAVLGASLHHDIPPSNILVVCDDIHLPFSYFRFRPSGSSGGQKGLADVIRCLGTNQFSRLRIGIGPVPDNISVIDFVLGVFNRAEAEHMIETIISAADAATDWLKMSMAKCQEKWN